jgi:histidyl-tRNA synthetase
MADLKVARGLDYYTGTVYETQMRGFEHFGSVCSGGRYDNLASSGTDRYPGVGVSVGVSRMLGLLFGASALSVSRAVPTCVLVAVASEEQRAASVKVAAALRARGIATEVSPSAAKYGRQIRYAERRGIPYVWFPAAGATGGAGVGEAGVAAGAGGSAVAGEVKDIRSGEQVPADATRWNPPPEDLRPHITATTPADVPARVSGPGR